MAKRRAVFLDRDGTINVEREYLHSAADFEFIPGAPQAIRLLNDAGFLVIVATNQSGVARGYYDESAISRLHRHLDAELARFGAAIDGYYICPHHPEYATDRVGKLCGCRKPEAGMLIKAANDFSLDLVSSYLIGDKLSDVEAGLNAGCRPILVRTGYGVAESAHLPADIPAYDDLLAAVRAILGEADSGSC
jgi:D-glycero-D-manno-heptose 1,7-bisphosphate phosphatase